MLLQKQHPQNKKGGINYMKTKSKKEMVYIAVIAVLVILVLILFFVMSSQKTEKKNSRIYEAGMYTREITIGDSTITIQVLLDEKNVTSVEVISGDIEDAMYPLLKPVAEKISKELSAGKSVDEITLSEESLYTEKLLLDVISEILQEHRIADTP